MALPIHWVDRQRHIVKTGSPSWIRTNDQVINSHLLYR